MVVNVDMIVVVVVVVEVVNVDVAARIARVELALLINIVER